MIQIGKTIIEEGIVNFSNVKERKTIRAVIYDGNNKVCMLYSGLYNDYTFAGGGLKDDECHSDALNRELNEEIGANEVKVIKPLGYTEEIRYGLNQNDSVYKQTSYYYLCEIDKITKPNYVGREELQDLCYKCVDIDDVIKHNEMVNKGRNIINDKGFTTVLKRENIVLNYIKEVLK